MIFKKLLIEIKIFPMIYIIQKVADRFYLLDIVISSKFYLIHIEANASKSHLATKYDPKMFEIIK